MNLFLIGYRGSGKSTVAGLIGQRLGWSAVDCDDEVERLSGRSIAEIFATLGESAFRRLETQALAEAAVGSRRVVALGGGAVLSEENRQLVRDAGRTVWLQALPETLWARLAADPASRNRRPNLTAGGGLAEIVAVLQARLPIYRQCADLEVDTEGKTPAQVAHEIIERLPDLRNPSDRT